jgi:hypothetical protein
MSRYVLNVSVYCDEEAATCTCRDFEESYLSATECAEKLSQLIDTIEPGEHADVRITNEGSVIMSTTHSRVSERMALSS